MKITSIRSKWWSLYCFFRIHTILKEQSYKKYIEFAFVAGLPTGLPAGLAAISPAGAAAAQLAGLRAIPAGLSALPAGLTAAPGAAGLPGQAIPTATPGIPGEMGGGRGEGGGRGRSRREEGEEGREGLSLLDKRFLQLNQGYQVINH